MPCAPHKNPGEYTVVDLNGGGIRASMDALPFESDSIDEIYSSHCLEHTPMHTIIPILREWRRVMKPGAELYLVVPSLEYCVRQWLNAPEEDRWDFKYYCIFARNEYPGDTHYTGFTVPRLRHYLREAGFTFEDSAVSEQFQVCHDQNEIRAIVRK